METLFVTSAVFVAHFTVINRKYIEPAMMREQPLAYVAGFGYYAAFIAVVLVVFRVIGNL